ANHRAETQPSFDRRSRGINGRLIKKCPARTQTTENPRPFAGRSDKSRFCRSDYPKKPHESVSREDPPREGELLQSRNRSCPGKRSLGRERPATRVTPRSAPATFPPPPERLRGSASRNFPPR